jgi:hypothetical protein
MEHSDLDTAQLRDPKIRGVFDLAQGEIGANRILLNSDRANNEIDWQQELRKFSGREHAQSRAGSGVESIQES